MPIKERRQVRPTTYLFFLALFAGIVLFSHQPFWRLPFFWDEVGQFVPDALDLYRAGSLIPFSADASVHPPGVSIYLASLYRLLGYSIPLTRFAMLTLASLGVLFAFLLAIELCKNIRRGAPAFLAILLLLTCPLFYTQAMLAQLDMPAMVFASLATLMFLQNRIRACAAACVVLVLMKETGVVFPVVFTAWLAGGKRWRDAAWFGAPCAVLTAWIAYLGIRTGHPFGPPNFTSYNIAYALHPVRIAAALVRRIYYLFFADFRWIGLIALAYAWKRSDVLRTRPWRIAASAVAANILLFSVTGGAVLDRYLLPALPIVFAAMAAAFTTLPANWRLIAPGVLSCAMLSCLFWNPPYPFPYENNLAFVDFVSVHQQAAAALSHADTQRITTAWPLSDELIREDIGYVRKASNVRPVPDLTPATLNALPWQPGDLLVLYSRQWDPPASLLRFAPVRWFCTRFYSYSPDANPDEWAKRRGWRSIVRWTQGGQWIEVYTKVEDGI